MDTALDQRTEGGLGFRWCHDHIAPVHGGGFEEGGSVSRASIRRGLVSVRCGPDHVEPFALDTLQMVWRETPRILIVPAAARVRPG
jgi:hypothetical protein